MVETHQLKGFRFDAAVCGVCPLRSQCVAGSSGLGRTVQLHPQEALQQQARALQHNEGDIIWLVPELVLDEGTGHYHLQRGHWEVLTLEVSTDKLLAAQTISRSAFEEALISKLTLLEPLI